MYGNEKRITLHFDEEVKTWVAVFVSDTESGIESSPDKEALIEKLNEEGGFFDKLKE